MYVGYQVSSELPNRKILCLTFKYYFALLFKLIYCFDKLMFEVNLSYYIKDKYFFFFNLR